MISLTRCNRPDHAKEYFENHLATGDSTTNPASPAPHLRATWTGPALNDVDIASDTTPTGKQLVRLGRGLHPSAKVRLAPDVNRKRAYYDVVISPPKTITLAAILEPSHPTAQSIAGCHVAAARKVAQEVGEMILPCSGTAPVKWLGAVFTHTHTREGDPQLHTHLVIPNIARNSDGNWRAIEINIAGFNRSKLDLIYGLELARQLRLRGLGHELAMRSNGLPEIRSLLPLRKRFSKATAAVLSASKKADAEHPPRPKTKPQVDGELHPRSGLPIPENRPAMRRRRRLADQIRRPKAKESDDPLKLNQEAQRWCRELNNPERRSLTRLLDDLDFTNPRRPPMVIERLHPAASLVVKAAYSRIHCDLKITAPLLLRAAAAESAGRHSYPELDAACTASLIALQATRKRIRAQIADQQRARVVAQIAASLAGSPTVPAGVPKPATMAPAPATAPTAAPAAAPRPTGTPAPSQSPGVSKKR